METNPQGNPIVIRLRELGATMQEIADAAGSVRSNVYSWLNGHWEPTEKHRAGLNALLIAKEHDSERKLKIKLYNDEILKLVK